MVLDYRPMAKELDVISWDSYPRFHNDYESLADVMGQNTFDHAVMRSMKKDKPFMLMESAPGLVNWHPYNKLKRPGIHKLFSYNAIACGSDTVQYFQWRKGRGHLNSIMVPLLTISEQMTPEYSRRLPPSAQSLMGSPR